MTLILTLVKIILKNDLDPKRNSGRVFHPELVNYAAPVIILKAEINATRQKIDEFDLFTVTVAGV